ncbi:hypothetical protein NE237_027814 [Protea cynaroides]|uniref:Uncharacterized protein n=1 Tax=Protea cynaroides TaxID=273540 RepID=A0A9Q0GS27_9MAGN|nr:hypothetical protein NE237_027814 [Protea cynaroides]
METSEEEEDRFFESREELTSLSDSVISPLVEQFMRQEVVETSNFVGQGVGGGSHLDYANPSSAHRVRPYRKWSKELSALYIGQEIYAHKGSILTMKFSLDGQCLASAGEDEVVRVWQVIETERSNEDGILDIGPFPRLYTSIPIILLSWFPFLLIKRNWVNSRFLRKTSDSACVTLPPKVFRLSEKPLHEFRGHNVEVLDLSWSKDKFLLSSPVDKTVRLWRVGFDGCFKVFFHNNYVTCVQFNPVDHNYFISGSIDGKIWMWEVSGSQVVDWTDIREIVTALSYHRDRQGGIVGFLTGNCRFYDASDMWTCTSTYFFP